MWGRDGGPALLQESDPGGSGELFVEGDDLIRAVGEADLGNQVVGETAARRAGGFAGLAGEVGGFGGDAAGAEQAFEGVEDSFRAPAGAKDPGKLGEDNEGQEDAASGARLGQGAACALRLGASSLRKARAQTLVSATITARLSGPWLGSSRQKSWQGS
jgi:hypothetical protein